MDPKPRLYHAVAVRWPAPPPEPHVEQLIAELDDCRVTAVDEDPVDGSTRFFFATAASRDRGAAILRAVDATATVRSIEVSDENWAERSQASITAVRVGGLTVAPPWDVPADGTAVIIIQPSMGFGTAHHESTRLCLRLLQQLSVTGQSVLDVGTGSGVLAIAASRRGAASVVGADADPDAIESARENLELNATTNVRLRVLDLADPGDLLEQRFDVLFANLTGGLLVRFAPALASLVGPGGALITSGFTVDEEPLVMHAFAEAHLAVASRLQEHEWVGAMFR